MAASCKLVLLLQTTGGGKGTLQHSATIRRGYSKKASLSSEEARKAHADVEASAKCFCASLKASAGASYSEVESTHESYEVQEESECVQSFNLDASGSNYIYQVVAVAPMFNNVHFFGPVLWSSRPLTEPDRRPIHIKAKSGEHVGLVGTASLDIEAVGTHDADSRRWVMYNLPHGGKIALKNVGNHRFLNANPEGYLKAEGTRVQAWEEFTLVQNADRTVSIRTCHGKYLCAESGGGASVVCNRDGIGPWEKFTLSYV